MLTDARRVVEEQVFPDVLTERVDLQWRGVVKGQDTGSGVNKVETTAGVWQQSDFTCSAADNVQHTHKILTLTHR